MNTTSTLTAAVLPTVHSRSTYSNSVLPAWKARAVAPAKLRTNRFLRSLPSLFMEKIERSLRTVELTRGEYLCEQEAIPEYVYFPETAVISHQKMLADGRTLEIALTGRESSLGMQSVFGSGISPSSAQVAQAGHAARIERELLIKTARLHPEIVPLLAADIGHYINDISCRSICNTHHDLRQRLSTWLLLVAHLSGKAALTVTHGQIGHSLGVFRPSVTNIVVRMRSDELIEYSRATVIIKDRRQLEQAACACYAELVKPKYSR